MLLLGAQSNPRRRLNASQRFQMGQIMAERLIPLLAEDPLMASFRLNITKVNRLSLCLCLCLFQVDVQADMQEMRVHWQCRGDETDAEMSAILEDSRHSLR